MVIAQAIDDASRWARRSCHLSFWRSNVSVCVLAIVLLFISIGYLLRTSLIAPGSAFAFDASLRLTTSNSRNIDKQDTLCPGIFTDIQHFSTNDEDVSEQTVDSGRDQLGARKRIGKASIIVAQAEAKTHERVMRTHERHNLIHGYPLNVLKHGMMKDVWSKPAYILRLLLREMAKPKELRLQWIFWMDADTVILNPLLPLQIFLPPSPEFDYVHLVMSHDADGKLNDAAFPIRVNQWAVELFAAIVSFRHYRPDDELSHQDQTDIETLLKERKFSKHTVHALDQRLVRPGYRIEHNEVSVNDQVRPGDFLLYFAGIDQEEQVRKTWLDRADNHQLKWKAELLNTSYPSELNKFWMQQSSLKNDARRLLIEAKIELNEVIQQSKAQLDKFHQRLNTEEAEAIITEQRLAHEILNKEDTDDIDIREETDRLKKVRDRFFN